MFLRPRGPSLPIFSPGLILLSAICVGAYVGVICFDRLCSVRRAMHLQKPWSLLSVSFASPVDYLLFMCCSHVAFLCLPWHNWLKASSSLLTSLSPEFTVWVTAKAWCGRLFLFVCADRKAGACESRTGILQGNGLKLP